MDKNIATLIRPQNIITLTVEEKSTIQNELMSFIEAHPLPLALQNSPLETVPLPSNTPVSVFFSSRLLPSWKAAAAALAVLVGIVALGTGVAIASQYSQPGNFLYPLKKNLERFFAPGRAPSATTVPPTAASAVLVGKTAGTPTAADIAVMNQAIQEIDAALAQESNLLNELSAADQARFASFLTHYGKGKLAFSAGDYEAAVAEFRAGANTLKAVRSLSSQSSPTLLRHLSPSTIQFIQTMLL